ncbi:MAG: aminopeptidase, partial [Ruminococcus sp.]
VPYSSPIRESGVLFFNTLYDENAACHVALGMGFKELYDPLMDVEEAKKVGINDSMIHVDFMIGTKDLNIIGVTEKGDTVQVFKDGEWTI